MAQKSPHTSRRKRRKHMGTFYATCQIENHIHRHKKKTIQGLLVDTGSEFTWINENNLKDISVRPEKKDVDFVMANGQTITRPMGYIIIHVGDMVTIDEVVFGQPGDLQLLGARTLEGLNLHIDPRQKKLVASGPILAA
jgi:predicted aspartyl protease